MSSEQKFFKTARKCPVCLSQEGILLHRIKYPEEEHRVLPADYRIIGCRSCGMVYDDFDADEKIFERHYRLDGKYGMAGSGGAGGNSVQDRKRWKKIFDILTPYLKNKEVSILDIGCGKGGLLQYFWEHGYHRLSGIDASPGCIEFIKNTYLFPAQCCSAEHFAPDRKFDIVISAQILEHLFFCRKYLEKIARFMSADGRLYLEMPDASQYLAYNKPPFYFFDHEHINHFQPDSLRFLLGQCGFSPIIVEQFKAEPVADFFTPNIAVLAKTGKKEEKLPRNDYSVIVDYIQDCEKRDLLIRHLPELEGQGYLWGVGAFCQRLLESGAFSKLNICGLIDIDPGKQGKTIHGIPVFSPEILANDSAGTFVIITSVLYEQEIQRILKEMHYTGKTVVLH